MQAFGNVPFDIVSIPTTDISAVVALVEGNTTTDIRGGTFIQGGQEARLAIMAFTGGTADQPDFVLRLAPGETKTEQGLVFNFQDNRNPFVDHPEWVACLFMDECDAGCPQDLDGDGWVGASDLAFVLGSWGPCEGCPTDFNGDGVVDAFDLAQVLGAWGMCP